MNPFVKVYKGMLEDDKVNFVGEEGGIKIPFYVYIKIGEIFMEAL